MPACLAMAGVFRCLVRFVSTDTGFARGCVLDVWIKYRLSTRASTGVCKKVEVRGEGDRE